MNVIIVDDHRMVAEALQTLLEGEPDVGSVRICGTAEEAFDACSSGATDVVLMDIELPGINGIDATRRLLQGCPDANVVIITAFGDPHVMARAIEAGASGFISKARAADELIDVVRKAAAGEMVLPDGQATNILHQLHAARRRDATGVPIVELSKREVEVLQAFADGLTSAQVAERLFISERTVQSHVRSVLGKLHVHSKLQAVLWALRRGLIRLSVAG